MIQDAKVVGSLNFVGPINHFNEKETTMIKTIQLIVKYKGGGVWGGDQERTFGWTCNWKDVSLIWHTFF